MADQPLVVCPVCETRQPNSWFCVVCGKALHVLPKHVPVTTPALEDLELTGLDAPRTNIAVQSLEGFESTHHVAAPSPAGPVSDGESVDFDITLVSDLEDSDTAGGEPVTPLAPVTCRACGTPWTPGASRICDGCGMRLTIPGTGPGSRSLADPTRPEERAPCPSCGARDQGVGERCRNCGHFVPPEE